MKCQILFSGKNKKNNIILSSAENAQRVVKVKLFSFTVSFSSFWLIWVVYILPDTQVMQWINKYGWSLSQDDTVYIANQEDNIKTKNITEKITFESKLLLLVNFTRCSVRKLDTRCEQTSLFPVLCCNKKTLLNVKVFVVLTWCQDQQNRHKIIVKHCFSLFWKYRSRVFSFWRVQG